jgi:hypothetical protein
MSWLGLRKRAGGDHHNDVVPSDRFSVDAVIAADVHPLPSIRRPDELPASVVAVVVIIGEAEANECEAAEAVIEEGVPELREARSPGAMCKARAGKAWAADKAWAGADAGASEAGTWADGGKTRTAAHPAELHAAATHAAAHTTCKSTSEATAHTAPTATAAVTASATTTTAAATTATAESRRSQSERSHERTRDK